MTLTLDATPAIPTGPVAGASYERSRARVARHFDETADRWATMTSDAPLGRVRRSVRAGRDRMRATLLGWLPADLAGQRVLDAGCGPGGLTVELAGRGARVTGVDVAPGLVAVARERCPASVADRVRFVAGDMLSPALGRFDHVVLMDSLLYYDASDVVRAVAQLALRTRASIVFTVAPRTPLLSAMHAAGRLFPRDDRAPAMQPVGDARLRRLVAGEPRLAGWTLARAARVRGGFYTSQAYELCRRPLPADALSPLALSAEVS